MRWVEPLAGVSLMTLVLADVFLTILYARAGTGIISDRLARLIWLTLRALPGIAAKATCFHSAAPLPWSHCCLLGRSYSRLGCADRTPASRYDDHEQRS
jgi:hypothetical protein